MKPELDKQSGEHTTGHEWDGIKELNTPVPRAISIWLWISIAVCVILWLLYPTWPSLRGYTKGLLGYSSRSVVADRVAEGQMRRQEALALVSKTDLTELAENTALRDQYSDTFGVLYRDNCAACHGRDLKGQYSFPNLTDGHWLWSGTPEEIEFTIQHGINHTSDETRYAEMLAFGRDEMLPSDEIGDVVEYVLSISGQDHDVEAAAKGTEIFADNCASCHGDGGTGGLEIGAPSLVDQAWIYGGSREALLKTVENGRAGVMPGWDGRLTPEEIKMLTIYVLWAGQDGGQN